MGIFLQTLLVAHPKSAHSSSKKKVKWVEESKSICYCLLYHEYSSSWFVSAKVVEDHKFIKFFNLLKRNQLAAEVSKFKQYLYLYSVQNKETVIPQFCVDLI